MRPICLPTAALGAIALLLAGCGGVSNSAGTTTRSYQGTQAPGDVWSYSIGTDSFSATNQTLSHDYTGSVVSLPSGFKKLTVATSTDSGVHAGDVAYSVEIPNTALLVKPVAGSAVVACGMGAQPTGSALQYNWITLPELNWTPEGSPAYGTADFTISGSTFTGTITSHHADDSIKNQFEDSFSYVGGTLIQPNDPDLIGAMTPSGTFMLDFGPQRGGAIGVLVPSSDIDKNEVTSHEFIGVLVRGGQSECVHAQGDGSGGFTGSGYEGSDGVETNTLAVSSEAHVTITLGTQIRPGLFNASLVSGEGTAPMVMVVNQANGKWIVYAFGTDSGAYNVMLVQK